MGETEKELSGSDVQAIADGIGQAIQKSSRAAATFEEGARELIRKWATDAYRRSISFLRKLRRTSNVHEADGLITCSLALRQRVSSAIDWAKSCPAQVSRNTIALGTLC